MTTSRIGKIPKDLESSVRAEVLSGHFRQRRPPWWPPPRVYLRQGEPNEQPSATSSSMGSIGFSWGDDAELLEQMKLPKALPPRPAVSGQHPEPDQSLEVHQPGLRRMNQHVLPRLRS